MTEKNNVDEKVIELSTITKGISTAGSNFSTFLFRCIQFIKRNFLVIVVLLILGFGIGLFLDKSQKSYDHEIIVSPNFRSADYLYSKIDLLKAKIIERDTAFLKAIGLSKPSNIRTISIKPIIDVYSFIRDSEHHYKMLALLAEDGDLNKIVQDPTTSRNYTYHTISFSTKEKIDRQSTIDPLIRFFNNNEYFKQIQKEYISNVNLKIAANDVTISQINAWLDNIKKSPESGRDQNLVYINEVTQLNDMLKTKDELLQEQGGNRISLLKTDAIIKENDSSLNMLHTSSMNGNLKYIFPLIFVCLFILFYLFRSFYRTQSIKQKLINL